MTNGVSKKESLLGRSTRGLKVVSLVIGLRVLFQFLSQLILVRLLAPEVFGIFAFISVVVGFLKLFMTIHAGKIIIQRSDRVQTFADTAFTLEVVLGTTITVGTILFSDRLMAFLGKPEMIPYMQVMALSILFNALKTPRALFERELKFFKANISTIGKIVASAVIAIALALLGFGVWSVVLGLVGSEFLEVVLVWKLVPYRPRLCINGDVARKVAGFGLPLSLSAILAYLYWNVDDFAVGRMLGNMQLGYYWLAFKFPHYIWQTHVAFGAVVLPAFSRAGNEDQLRRGFELVTKYSVIGLLFPCIIVLTMGQPTVSLIFGRQWLSATRAFQILTVAVAVRGSFAFVSHLYQSKGTTWPLLTVTGVNTVVLTSLIYPLTLHYGIEGAAGSVLITVCVSLPIAVHLLNRMIRVNYRKLIFNPICASIATAVVLRVIVYFVAIHDVTLYFSVVALAGLIYAALLFTCDRTIWIEIKKFAGIRKLNVIESWQTQQL